MTQTLAKTLLSEITSKVQELNSVLSSLSADQLREAGLQTRYWFGGAGSPQAGLGFKSIIPVNEEHTRGKAFQSDIDYDHYRKKLRNNHVNEAEIWIRFPARNAEEELEKEIKMTAWRARRERKILIHDPFKAYCLSEAKKLSKTSFRSVESILLDPEFQQTCKTLWEIVI